MQRDLIQLKITDEDLEILKSIYGTEMIRDFLQFKKAVVTFNFYGPFGTPIPKGAPNYKELFDELVGVVNCFRKDIAKVKAGNEVAGVNVIDF